MDLTSTNGESLAVILNQGLTSSDAEKIDAVLLKSDMQTISATLNDLPAAQIIPLLKEIEYRCRNRRHFEYGCSLLSLCTNSTKSFCFLGIIVTKLVFAFYHTS